VRKKFGELLLEQGLITPAQLADALAYQRRTGMRLGAALVARAHIDEGQLVMALGTALRVPVVRLSDLRVEPAALQKVSLELCSEHDLFPYALRRERGRVVLTVATSDPLNFRLLDELEFMTACKVEAVLARASDIDQAIRKHYGPRLARPYQVEDVVLALKEDTSGMTILRRGGDEERINTQTGPVKLPDAAQLLQNAPVSLPKAAPPPLPEVSAVLLTDEVTDETPVDGTPIPLTEVKSSRPAPAEGRPTPPPAPVTRPTPMASASAPSQWPPPAPSTVPTQAPAPVAPESYGAPAAVTPGAREPFDDALGALIDAASDSDHAEAVLRLERKFWALMRVLAKKGLLTNQDFLQELGEEEKWRR
jgi:hypothetical protein